jgi:hypothetical protein
MHLVLPGDGTEIPEEHPRLGAEDLGVGHAIRVAGGGEVVAAVAADFGDGKPGKGTEA